MPAHTKDDDVGRLLLSDGSLLTEVDRLGNAEADRLAKLGAQSHRVPKAVRECIKEHHQLVERTARWIARATWAAGHQTVRPLRDTDASRAAAVAAARQRAQERGSCDRRGRSSKVVELRPVALGGHSLRHGGVYWSCKRCKARSKQYSKLAPQVCTGSAMLRWAEKAQTLTGTGIGDGGGHSRVLSGDLVWCARCGAYAQSVAKGLSKPCPGRIQGAWRRGGLLGQLKVLQSGRHPKTFEQLPRPIPESMWRSADASDDPGGDDVTLAQLLHTDLRPPQHPESSGERRTALFARIRAKEAASKVSGESSRPEDDRTGSETRRRIVAKRSPPWCNDALAKRRK